MRRYPRNNCHTMKPNTAKRHSNSQKEATYMTTAQIRKKREELFALGINLRELCEQKGVSYQAARDLLCGKARGRRGEAHRAAVALGLKPAPATLKLAA